MLKQVITVLLFVPAITWAECGFVSNSSEMTIVVGKDANNKCFKSESFRDAFRSNLVAAVKHMDENSPAEKPAVARRPRPPGLPLPVQQAELYYGQNTKR